MKTTTKKISLVLVFSLISLSLTNCKAIQDASNAEKGAVIGVGAGGVLGAIIGNNVGKGGNGELGAVIGGAVGGVAGAIIGTQMDKQAEKIEAQVSGVKVERVGDGIVLTFEDGSGIFFDTNQSTINASSQETLDKLTRIFKEYSDTNILVVGHTDSVGDENYNMTLSKNRAYAVSNYLNSHGINSGRLTTNWFGESKPLHDNNTANGRAKNRRVNVAILPNEQMISDAKKQANN